MARVSIQNLELDTPRDCRTDGSKRWFRCRPFPRPQLRVRCASRIPQHLGIMDRRISVIGLGYVGLPVAVSFARTGASVVAFDIDPRRISELINGFDRTGEVIE